MAGTRSRGPTLAKDINRKLVYNALKAERHSTRAELASRLGLNKNTVNAIVDELIGSGYVRETGLRKRSGAGRKAIGIEFAAANRKAVGIQLTPTAIRGVVTDLYAAPLRDFELPLPDLSPEGAAAGIAACAETAIKREGADAVIGIGVGIPALLDPERATVLGASHLGWRGVPFKRLLQDKLPGLLELDNHVKLASLGERWHGQGSGAEHFIYCSFGVGVGCGLVIGGEIVRGEYGAAGELGHIVVQPDGPPCSCGNRGCLEAVAGLPAICGRLAEAAGLPAAALNEKWLADQASRGNGTVLRELERVGRAIGRALSAAVNLINPKVIICDGPLMRAADALLPAIEAELSRGTLAFAGNKAKLVVSSLYPHAAAIGAAAAVISAWERQADPLEAMTL
jgi:predicted NBD/HSP70 family sugar kinase